MKEVYVSEIVGPDSRGRPLWRWRDRGKEYMCEGCATEQTRKECLDRDRCRLFGCGHPHGGHLWREQGIRAVDR